MAPGKGRRFVVVGDKVLIRPKAEDNMTDSGLFLPPGVREKEKIQSGYVLQAGPGFPIPHIAEEEEPWKKREEHVKYIPLQAQEGDLAIYLQSSAYEIEFNKEKYVIVPQAAILLLIREEE